MFSKITCEFDSIEFAEFAAKHIKSSVKTPMKITITPVRRKFERVLKNTEPTGAVNGNVFYLLPAAVTSYNYITGSEVRPVNKDMISEPLLNRAVILAVQTDKKNADIITGVMTSYGGYNIKK